MRVSAHAAAILRRGERSGTGRSFSPPPPSPSSPPRKNPNLSSLPALAGDSMNACTDRACARACALARVNSYTYACVCVAGVRSCGSRPRIPSQCRRYLALPGPASKVERVRERGRERERERERDLSLPGPASKVERERERERESLGRERGGERERNLSVPATRFVVCMFDVRFSHVHVW